LIKVIIWDKRPGIASILIPREGIVQEWITSSEETINRIKHLIGSTKWLNVSINRKFNLSLFKIPSKLLFKISYLQYHWWPLIFKVKSLSLNSSHIYKFLILGKPIKTKKITGIDNHISSNLWLSKKFVEKKHIIFNKQNIIEIEITNIKIKIKVRSLKNIKNSIIGLFLFCKKVDDHKEIRFY
jgi:hypothetical protein